MSVDNRVATNRPPPLLRHGVVATDRALDAVTRNEAELTAFDRATSVL